MALSWAERSKQGKHVQASISNVKPRPALKVTVQNKPLQTRPPTSKPTDGNSNKPQVPQWVREERDPHPDDDIVMYANHDDDDEDDYKEDIQPLRVIPDEEFVINHFNVSIKQIFFQLIINYLERDDVVRFFTCYRKYCKMFRGDEKQEGMLYVWKYLYHRDYGNIRYQKRRRCKLSQQEQRQKHQQRLKDGEYWKTQYEYRDRAKFLLSLQGNKRHGWRLTFYRSVKNIRWIRQNDMIIVTPERCNAADLLDYDNFVYSNWYDVEDRRLLTYQREYGGYYNWWHTTHVHRKEIKDDEAKRYGYREVSVDPMMQNMQISRLGIRAFVYPVCYVKLTCYLIEILQFKMMDDLDKMEKTMEKRKCTLLTVPEKGERADSGKLMIGWILNRVLGVEELETKMLEAMQRGQKLKVCVYAMGFGYNSLTLDDLQRDWIEVKYVVVDYYDE